MKSGLGILARQQDRRVARTICSSEKEMMVTEQHGISIAMRLRCMDHELCDIVLGGPCRVSPLRPMSEQGSMGQSIKWVYLSHLHSNP